ncbi:MAG: peptide deformylase [Candidatus Andersenbacteria bacterium]|nr:peptide deformylase [Candidatus Andersenbacteria bacterium]
MQGQAPPGIVTVGDPFLRRKTRLVKPRDRGQVRILAKKMSEKLEELNAQGIAAPQVRERFRLVVIRTRPTKVSPDVEEMRRALVLVNPEIVGYSTDFVWRWEGCLSVPGLMGKVRRYSAVKVKFEDLDGGGHCESFSGFLARVVQHEVDHLDNLLYLDQLPPERTAVQNITTFENYSSFNLKAA